MDKLLGNRMRDAYGTIESHFLSTREAHFLTDMTTTQKALHDQYDMVGGATNVFSAKVADYIASRPDYPAALFEELAARCDLKSQSHITDVGAGTGLLTRDLLARDYRVTAIEPNREMRDACDALLGHNAHYRSVEGTAESMPLADDSVDLVTAATAFHWFKIAESRRECLRVLRANAQVALIWNDRVLTDPLHVAMNEVFAEFGGAKRDALIAHEDRQSVPEFFGGDHAQVFGCPYTHSLDAKGFVSLAFSRSYMPARESHSGQRAIEQLRRIFEQFAHEDRVAVKYTTVAYIGRPA
jgi:SAM-dependent methyltransferase